MLLYIIKIKVKFWKLIENDWELLKNVFWIVYNLSFLKEEISTKIELKYKEYKPYFPIDYFIIGW